MRETKEILHHSVVGGLAGTEQPNFAHVANRLPRPLAEDGAIRGRACHHTVGTNVRAVHGESPYIYIQCIYTYRISMGHSLSHCPRSQQHDYVSNPYSH